MKDNIFNDSIVLLDKPVGITSFDTISRFKRLVNLKKVGHSGTLDKFASGLLIIGTGKATKLTRYFLESDKKYEGVVQLGISTDTCDITGEVLSKASIEKLSKVVVEEAFLSFKGEGTQLPPKYSALKINGKRASDLIRSGEEVELKERPVNIYDVEVLSVDLTEGLVRFSVFCSKGTYIRSIARDLGEILGCGACLKELRRTTSGSFSVDNAATIEEVEASLESKPSKDFILSPEKALSYFGEIFLNEEGSRIILNGAYFTRDQVDQIEKREGDLFLVFDNRHNLRAIVEIDIDKWNINFHSVFNN